MASNNNNNLKITDNISTLQKILNYYRVHNHISTPSLGGFLASAKWANSMYRNHIGLSGSSRDISGANGDYPHYEHIGHGDSIISPEMYNKIHNIVLTRQSEFYVQVDEGQVDEVTDLVIAILEGSATVYSMLLALYRTQNGYLFKDEDKVYLGPVFFNHENKGASVADWNVTPGNYSFAEVVQQTSLNTQAKIINSNEVWGCYPIANEPWGNLVSAVVNSCYLPHNLRWMLEHLFATVFVDPQKSVTFGTVTFYPDSTLNIYSYDSGTSTWQCTPTNLNGYDSNSNDDGATNLDNGGVFSDFITYVDAWSGMISEMFNHYPYLDSILADLKFTNKCNFDFTRKIQHDQVFFVVKENISDFIQSAAMIDANPEVPDIHEKVSLIAEVVPFTVRDQTEIGYGNTLDYSDETSISLDFSFEYFWRGKVYSERFAIFMFNSNSNVGDYRYSYNDVRICSDFGDVNKTLSLMYLNADLRSYGAIQTLMEIEMSSIPASGLGGSGIIIIPTIRCYYNALENVGNYAYRAYDTFVDDKFSKVK